MVCCLFPFSLPLPLPYSQHAPPSCSTPALPQVLSFTFDRLCFFHQHFPNLALVQFCQLSALLTRDTENVTFLFLIDSYQA